MIAIDNSKIHLKENWQCQRQILTGTPTDSFDNYNINTDFDKLRAKVDSDALRKRYSNFQIFNKYEPANNNEKKLYEISEKSN